MTAAFNLKRLTEIFVLLFIQYYFLGHLTMLDKVSFIGDGLWIQLVLIWGIISTTYLLFKNSKIASVGIFCSWVFLCNLNPFVVTAFFPILSIWLMLFCIKNFIGEESTQYQYMLRVFLVYFAFTYVCIGLDKLQNDLWRSGELIQNLNRTVMVRDAFKFYVPGLTLSQIISWLVIFTETAAFLLVFKKFQKFYLPLLICLHVGVAVLMPMFLFSLPYILVLLWLSQQKAGLDFYWFKTGKTSLSLISTNS